MAFIRFTIMDTPDDPNGPVSVVIEANPVFDISASDLLNPTRAQAVAMQMMNSTLRRAAALCVDQLMDAGQLPSKTVH